MKGKALKSQDPKVQHRVSSPMTRAGNVNTRQKVKKMLSGTSLPSRVEAKVNTCLKMFLQYHNTHQPNNPFFSIHGRNGTKFMSE